METACCSRKIKKVKRHHSCSPFDEELVNSDNEELTSKEITCKSRCREAEPQPSEEISEVFQEVLALHHQMKEMADLSHYIPTHDQERKIIHQRAKVKPHNKRNTRSSSIIILNEDTSPQKISFSSGASTKTLQGRVTIINDLLSKQDRLFREMDVYLQHEFSGRRELEDLTLLKLKMIELEKELEEKESLIVELQRILKDMPVLFEVQTLREEMHKKMWMEQVALDQKSSFDREVKAEVSRKCLNVLNAELTCDICSEWFIKATTTQCTHTFCTRCLTTWRRENENCPLCRANITASVPSLVIDNCIAKMVENLSVEDQLKRKSEIEERERCETILTHPTTTDEEIDTLRNIFGPDMLHVGTRPATTDEEEINNLRNFLSPDMPAVLTFATITDVNDEGITITARPVFTSNVTYDDAIVSRYLLSHALADSL